MTFIHLKNNFMQGHIVTLTHMYTLLLLLCPFGTMQDMMITQMPARTQVNVAPGKGLSP